MAQQRVVLRNCDVVDPGDIDSYLAQRGFAALQKALGAMSSGQVVEEIKKSGLRGRGGAGFPVGVKWDLAANAEGDEKYIVCNADEGEVGTFKDRYILERDPFGLVEGIAIGAHAIGARKGYIYLRAEYHRLLPLLQNAINQAKEKGLLADPLGLDIEIREGAGAYVCGEETALMESIEGSRGEARYRPPFPPTRGLWEKPTVINNVETLMNIAPIVLEGAEWFNGMGTERSKGTKVFSVSGDVGRPGVYELVMGSTLRELVEDLALAKNIKMVQVGGASGRILPYEQIDTPLAFESVLGAGAVVVFDESRNVVDIVRRTMEFFVEESCGKCTPCRQGTELMLEILTGFTQGRGSEEDIRVLKQVGSAMMLTALCGLGQAAPNVVMDTLEHFGEAYHVQKPA